MKDNNIPSWLSSTGWALFWLAVSVSFGLSVLVIDIRLDRIEAALEAHGIETGENAG